jgi:hypothetical protein
MSGMVAAEVPGVQRSPSQARRVEAIEVHREAKHSASCAPPQDKSYTLPARAVLCITANEHREWQRWVDTVEKGKNEPIKIFACMPVETSFS